MRKRHTLGATLRGHWSLWVHSPRTVIALAFVAMMTVMFTRAQHLLYEASGYALHLGEMVYASVNQGFHVLNTSIGFLVMISEIPKRIAWQKYALIRQSRGRWLISLVAFCAMISALFLAAMLLSATLCSAPYAASSAKRPACPSLSPGAPPKWPASSLPPCPACSALWSRIINPACSTRRRSSSSPRRRREAQRRSLPPPPKPPPAPPRATVRSRPSISTDSAGPVPYSRCRTAARTGAPIALSP